MPNPYLAAALREQQDRRRSIAAENEGYVALTVDALKAEIDKRNESRADDARLTKTGSKADLVAALEADDNNEES